MNKKKLSNLLLGSLLVGVMTFGAVGLLNVNAENASSTKLDPINYYKGSTANATLETNGLYDGKTKGKYFDAIRIENKTAQSNNCDGKWWRYQNIWMGVGDASNPLDLTNSQFTLEVMGSANNSWVSFDLLDADGDMMTGNGTIYKTATFNGNPTVSATDWHGVWVGDTHGKIALSSWINETYPNFNWDKVVAIAPRIDTWDAKTFEYGKLGVVKNGVETTIFDPVIATQLTEVPVNGLKGMTKGQWLWGPRSTEISSTNTCAALRDVTSSFLTVEYRPYVDKNTWYIEKTVDKANTWAWVPIVEYNGDTELTTYKDVTGYEGIQFDIDTTGLTDKLNIDFLIRIKNADNSTTDYKAFGNKVLVMYVSESGEVKTNQQLGVNGNYFPKDFKGTVYMPFGAFENGSTLLTSVANFGSKITAMRAIVANHLGGLTVGDTAVLTNIQAFDCGTEHADANDDYVCDQCHANLTYQSSAKGASISLTEDIALNFYFNLPVGLENVTATATVAGVDTQVNGVYVESEKAYRFTYPVAPKDYEKEVTMSVAGTKVYTGVTATTSVSAYINNNKTNENLSEVLTSLENYCLAANAYFAETEVTEDTTEIDMTKLAETKANVAGEQAGVALLGASLVVEDKTTIRVYFTAETLEGLTIKVNDTVVTATAVPALGENVYVVVIDDIVARDLDNAYVVSIGGCAVTYSAYSYVYSVLTNSQSTVALKNVAKALYAYGNAANEYFN